MWISRYLLYFILYSFLGWIWETIFCTVKSGRWASRGFLYGPVCPIYGFGGLVIQVIADLAPGGSAQSYAWWQVFLFSFMVCTCLEYATHWLLEKLFHAYWWDYTNMPLNLHGRVCLPASLLFGVAGVFSVYVLLPNSQGWFDWLPPILIEGLSLLLTMLVSMDLTLTVSALTNFERDVVAMEERINQHMEQFVSGLPGAKPGMESAMETEMAQQERERFSHQSMEQLAQSMGLAYRGAVGRIKGYRQHVPKKGEVLKHRDELEQRLERMRVSVEAYLSQKGRKSKKK